MTTPRLDLTRDQIVGYRRAVSHLDERLPPGPSSLREAAWAGLTDSMPRAALLSIHARVEGTEPTALDDPSLAQVWGPRFSAYVVAEADAPIFTLGRLPIDAGRRARAERTADELDAFLAGRTMPYAEAGRGMGVAPNSLRYGAPTGRIRIRWEGARQPTIWTTPPPAMSPDEARLELARRFLHVFGPATASAFEQWAGIRAPGGRTTFEALRESLIAVATPVGESWILASDEVTVRGPAGPTGGPRLLPSGDTFFLLQARDRGLLVPDPKLRSRLWTSRVWPGCLLVDGEPAGTWRRADATIAMEPWRSLSVAERDAVETEAASLPLPGIEGRISVRWPRDLAA